MVRVDQLCAQHNIKVFCGDVFGYHGYMFSDLGQEHNYVEWVLCVIVECLFNLLVLINPQLYLCSSVPCFDAPVQGEAQSSQAQNRVQ